MAPSHKFPTGHLGHTPPCPLALWPRERSGQWLRDGPTRGQLPCPQAGQAPPHWPLGGPARHLHQGRQGTQGRPWPGRHRDHGDQPRTQGVCCQAVHTVGLHLAPPLLQVDCPPATAGPPQGPGGPRPRGRGPAGAPAPTSSCRPPTHVLLLRHAPLGPYLRLSFGFLLLIPLGSARRKSRIGNCENALQREETRGSHRVRQQVPGVAAGKHRGWRRKPRRRWCRCSGPESGHPAPHALGGRLAPGPRPRWEAGPDSMVCPGTPSEAAPLGPHAQGHGAAPPTRPPKEASARAQPGRWGAGAGGSPGKSGPARRLPPAPTAGTVPGRGGCKGCGASSWNPPPLGSRLQGSHQVSLLLEREVGGALPPGGLQVVT